MPGREYTPVLNKHRVIMPKLEINAVDVLWSQYSRLDLKIKFQERFGDFYEVSNWSFETQFRSFNLKLHFSLKGFQEEF